MKCEKGDIAKIIMSIRPGNIGKQVLVEDYIGHFKQGDTFDFRGILCKALVTDHYWWIAAEYGLQNMLGDTPKAYIADSWLEPIRPEKMVKHTKEEVDISA
jgi:hypothetical protein